MMKPGPMKFFSKGQKFFQDVFSFKNEDDRRQHLQMHQQTHQSTQQHKHQQQHQQQHENNINTDYSKNTSHDTSPSPSKRKCPQQQLPQQQYQHQQYTPHKSQFTFKSGQRIENATGLLNKIVDLFNRDDLSDVKINVRTPDGVVRQYPSHRLVLACSSQVFKVMFTGIVWNEATKSEVTLSEDVKTGQVFEAFLRYLYSRVIYLQHPTVLYILMLADKYDVIDLQKACTEYMIEHLVSTTQLNRSTSWLSYARLANHKTLAHDAAEFIRLNFYKVISGPDFLHMDADMLISFISQSEIVIPDEFILYQGVVRWWFKNTCYYNDEEDDEEDDDEDDDNDVIDVGDSSDVFRGGDDDDDDGDEMNNLEDTSAYKSFWKYCRRKFTNLKDENIENDDDDDDDDEDRSDSSDTNIINNNINSDNDDDNDTHDDDDDDDGDDDGDNANDVYKKFNPSNSPSRRAVTEEPHLHNGLNNVDEKRDYDNDVEENCDNDLVDDDTDDDDDVNDDSSDDSGDVRELKDMARKIFSCIRYPLMGNAQLKAIFIDIFKFYQSANRRILSSQTANHRTSPSQSANHRTSPSRSANHRTSLTQSANHKTSSFQSANHKTSSFQSANHKTSTSQSANQTTHIGVNNIPRKLTAISRPTKQHSNRSTSHQRSPVNHQPNANRKKVSAASTRTAATSRNVNFLKSKFYRKCKAMMSVLERYVVQALHLQDIVKKNVNETTEVQSYARTYFQRHHVTLRNYTNDVWSTSLVVDKFSSVNRADVRSVVFSSPSDALQPDETTHHPAWDWTGELYSRGMVYQPCIMLNIWTKWELPGDTFNTVRLVLHSNQSRDTQQTSSSGGLSGLQSSFFSFIRSESSSPGKGKNGKSQARGGNKNIQNDDGVSACSSSSSSSSRKQNANNRRDVELCVLVTGVQDNVEHFKSSVSRQFSFDPANDRTRFINDLVPFHLLNQPSSASASAQSPYLSGSDGNSFKMTIIIKPTRCSLFDD